MNLVDLTGKVVVVVVAVGARGIGQMITAGLLPDPDAVAEPAGFGTVHAIAADLSRDEECVRLAAELGEREPGGGHVLVNDAGVAWGAPLADFPESGRD